MGSGYKIQPVFSLGEKVNKIMGFDMDGKTIPDVQGSIYSIRSYIDVRGYKEYWYDVIIDNKTYYNINECLLKKIL